MDRERDDAPVTGKGKRNEAGTASQILDVAERLVQTRGYNGFSYADVAAELSMTKAGLHYHFRGKGELGEALVTRYAQRFAGALAGIDSRTADAGEKLRGYAELYAAVLRDQRMCLCGMLAADYQTLPEPMREAVVRFFDDNEKWVERVLAAGRRKETLTFVGSARESARLIVSGLEGAMLVGRPYGDVARFQRAADLLLAGFAPPSR